MWITLTPMIIWNSDIDNQGQCFKEDNQVKSSTQMQVQIVGYHLIHPEMDAL